MSPDPSATLRRGRDTALAPARSAGCSPAWMPRAAGEVRMIRLAVQFIVLSMSLVSLAMTAAHLLLVSL